MQLRGKIDADATPAPESDIATFLQYFETMYRRSGGVSREQVIALARQLLEDFRALIFVVREDLLPLGSWYTPGFPVLRTPLSLDSYRCKVQSIVSQN